jgi:hypothetical protein
VKKTIFLLVFLLLFPVFIVLPQSAGTAAAAPAEAAENDKSPKEDAEEEEEEEEEKVSYIEMDIKTSTLLELAAWCRELGLSDGGSWEQLASRLRSHYNLRSQRSAYQPGQQIITIESAKTTEYFTLEVVDEEYARLKGDVIVSLKDGATVHRIKAWEILYNRTRNVMTATGNVEYTKEEGSTVETFRGESITVNLDNWSSIFMDGSSQKSTVGRSATFRFAGTVVSRNSEGATILTGAEITNPANEEAYWSLYASKLWLLPGNDWAILNAVLKVGNIPLLYLPFFFYPADEIVFHPVLGYRSREGTFLQTTTYVLGRPKSSGLSENSITRIFGGDSDSGNKVREGVFLRTSKEKTTDPSATQLSLLFDAYVNLGAYLGAEMTMPAKGLFGETKLSAGLGLTRDIFVSGGNYTPFRDSSGESSWNSSRFFFMDVPLRYRFVYNTSFKLNNGSLSLDIPYYSDPYVNRDFMRRSEVLDWLAMLREGVTASDVVSNTSISSYEWKLNGSFNLPVPKLAPYINSFSISNLSSTLVFNQRYSGRYSGPSAPPNPGRAFFFPNRFTIFSISAALAGIPLRTGNTPQSQTVSKTEPPPGDALLSDLPISPWGSTENETDDAYTRAVSGVYDFSPPVLGQSFSLPAAGGALLSVDYTLRPATATELQFRTDKWGESKDINWGEVSSVFSSFRSDAGLGFNLNHAGGSAYAFSLRLSGTGSWQEYMYLNREAEEFSNQKAVKDARDRAYKETYFTSSWGFSTTFRPFFRNPVWNASNFQYGLGGLLAKTTVNTSGNTPVWDWVLADWNKTDISSHQVSANLAATIRDYNQNLSFSAVLPPRDSVFSSSAVFRAWITETSVRNSISFPLESDKRKIEPVYFTETLRFSQGNSFQQYVVYDPALNEYTTITSNLSLSLGLSASFSTVYAQPYRYNYNGSVDNSRPNGWIQMRDKSLNPNEFKLTYGKTFSQNSLWGNRLSYSLSLNTSLAFDLQRYTNSKFSFSLGVKTKITNFIDLDFSTSSENAVIFKYFQGLPFFSLPTQLYPGQETNIFMDLLNSFRFDNDDLRRQSGFKMKALRVSLVHHLGDWNASLSVTMTPYLPQGSRNYRFSNDISFLIQWIPIGEIKTQIDYSKDILTIK